MSKVPEKLFRVFVYGTLKRGEPNHHWLTKRENGFSKFITEGVTEEVIGPLVIGTRYNIPFLLDKRGTGCRIKGEVYEVDEQMFKNLDVLEDYPNYYDREEQLVVSNGKEKFLCWLYLIRKYPEQMLRKEYLEEYHNTPEKPYCESYIESVKEDMYDELEPQVST